MYDLHQCNYKRVNNERIRSRLNNFALYPFTRVHSVTNIQVLPAQHILHIHAFTHVWSVAELGLTVSEKVLIFILGHTKLSEHVSH